MYSTFITSSFILFKARFLHFSLLVVAACIASAYLSAQFSGRQPATISLDIGISVLRLTLPLLIALMTQELITKEFERRQYLSSLTYPITRTAWLLGRFAALVGLLFLLIILSATLLASLSYWIGLGYQQSTPPSIGLGYWLNTGMILLDLLVICTVAFFLAVLAKSPGFVLVGTIGFTLIARSYSGIVQLLEQDEYLVSHTDQYQASLGLLHYVLPDLGALDARAAALYNSMQLWPDDWLITVASCFVYAALMLGLATLALQRKNLA